MKLLKYILLIGTVGIFFFAHFFINYTYLYSGIFIVILILISLQKFSIKKILLISSTIAAYPTIWIITSFLPGSINTKIIYLLLLSILFVGSYSFILKNIWSWIDPKFIVILIASLSLLSLFALFFSGLEINCLHISAAEKGVSAASIELCKIIGHYSENFYYTSKVGLVFAGLYFRNFVSVYFPIIITIIVMGRSFMVNKPYYVHQYQ
jgi:hypothetical protein